MAMLEPLWYLYRREVMKITKGVLPVVLTFIQPILWIVFFGSSLNGLPRETLIRMFGTTNYMAFIIPGQLAIVMMSVGVFSSMSMVWDRKSGFLMKVLITPAPREVVFLSKVLGAMTRGLIQVPIVLLTAIAFGIPLPLNPLDYAVWFLGLALLSIGFSSLYLAVTLRSSDPQIPHLLSGVFSLPLMFASTAFFPITFFPLWMRVIASINPITFAVEIGREALFGDPINPTPLYYLTTFALTTLTIGLALTRKYLAL